ncbi:MAG: hypothetical protein NT045_07490, partial [Candidatus Aureabacteria bacterium]|nr:hypothetical protein [Candidatus Auribacterota bacterium]
TPEYGVPELEDTARGLLAAPCYVAHNLDAVCGELGGRARIAITDYSVMFTDIPTVVHGAHPVNGRPEASIEWERNTYCVSALVEAMFLNLFIRRSEVDIACRFSLLSQLYSTLYRYADGRWIATPQALVHALYNRLAGHLCVHLSMEVDGYDSPACGVIPSMRGVPCLDGLAVRSARGDKLIISLVNRNIESDVQAEIMINGFEARQMTVKTMSAPQFYSRNTAQTPDNILLHERTLPVPDPSKALQVKVPKHSLMFLVLDREEWL